LAYLLVMRSPVPDIDAFGLEHSHFGQRLILNDRFDTDKGAQALSAV
jgi:N-ethylmaleimide reductase